MGVKGKLTAFGIMVGLVLCFLALPLIFAQMQTLGVFQQNEIVNLIQTCDNCTYVNISSVTFPNSTVAVSNAVMTKDGTIYNYTFSQTNTIGTYIVNTFGDDDGTVTAGSYTFEITQTGSTLSTAQGIVYVIFLSAIIFTFLLVFYGAVKLPYRNGIAQDGVILGINYYKYAKIILFAFSYLILMFIFGITKSILENFLFWNGAYRVFNLLYWVMFSALWPLMVASVVFTIIVYVTDDKLKKAMMRGVKIR